MKNLKQTFISKKVATVALLTSLSIALINAQPIQASSLNLNYIGQFPNQFIPAPNSIPTTSGIRNNLALESLTITPDQRCLFTASENALVQDGPEATINNGTSSRILQYDLTTGLPVAQFVYNTDPVALPPNPSISTTS